MPPARLPVPGFFMAGFECSTHRRRDGARLDLAVGTGHARFARQDYSLAAGHGMRTVRDGLRWHLIEQAPGRYDWSSWRPMLAASREAGVRVVWDIWHYGTPDHLDIWSPAFVDALAAFAGAAARLFREESDETPLWCPLNEISFYSFIAGEAGDFHPYGKGRGYELKRQLARAAVAVSETLLSVDPRARLLWAEPLIEAHPKSLDEADVARAAAFNRAQFQALDMISGRLEPEIGGRPGLLDVVGANFYPHNQWVIDGDDDFAGAVPVGHHAFRPFAEMLAGLHDRYRRPIVVAETGAEGSGRAPWIHYVCQEVETAIEAGTPVEGVCLYPVVNYPGWDDDRRCATGLFGPPDEDGVRAVYAPAAEEVARWQARMAPAARIVDGDRVETRDPAAPALAA